MPPAQQMVYHTHLEMLQAKYAGYAQMTDPQSRHNATQVEKEIQNYVKHNPPMRMVPPPHTIHIRRKRDGMKILINKKDFNPALHEEVTDAGFVIPPDDSDSADDPADVGETGDESGDGDDEASAAVGAAGKFGENASSPKRSSRQSSSKSTTVKR